MKFARLRKAWKIPSASKGRSIFSSRERRRAGTTKLCFCAHAEGVVVHITAGGSELQFAHPRKLRTKKHAEGVLEKGFSKKRNVVPAKTENRRSRADFIVPARSFEHTFGVRICFGVSEGALVFSKLAISLGYVNDYAFGVSFRKINDSEEL